MNALTQIRKLVGDRAKVVDLPEGHVQIRGKIIVNYYPNSKRRTCYVAGMTGGIKDVTPEQAVEYAMNPRALKESKSKFLRRHKRRPKTNRSFKAKEFARVEKATGKSEVPCYWCEAPLGYDEATVDHVIPLSRNGLDHDNNKVIACEPCNRGRANSMPERGKGHDR